MPSYTFKSLWTPLEWLGIRLYKNITEDSLWIKIGHRRRRPLFPQKAKPSSVKEKDKDHEK